MSLKKCGRLVFEGRQSCHALPPIAPKAQSKPEKVTTETLMAEIRGNDQIMNDYPAYVRLPNNDAYCAPRIRQRLEAPLKKVFDNPELFTAVIVKDLRHKVVNRRALRVVGGEVKGVSALGHSKTMNQDHNAESTLRTVQCDALKLPKLGQNGTYSALNKETNDGC